MTLTTTNRMFTNLVYIAFSSSRGRFVGCDTSGPLTENEATQGRLAPSPAPGAAERRVRWRGLVEWEMNDSGPRGVHCESMNCYWNQFGHCTTVFRAWGAQFVSLGSHCSDCGESHKGLLEVSDSVGDPRSNRCRPGAPLSMDRGSEHQEILDKKHPCVGNFHFYENFHPHKNRFPQFDHNMPIKN